MNILFYEIKKLNLDPHYLNPQQRNTYPQPRNTYPQPRNNKLLRIYIKTLFKSNNCNINQKTIVYLTILVNMNILFYEIKKLKSAATKHKIRSHETPICCGYI